MATHGNIHVHTSKKIPSRFAWTISFNRYMGLINLLLIKNQKVLVESTNRLENLAKKSKIDCILHLNHQYLWFRQFSWLESNPKLSNIYASAGLTDIKFRKRFSHCNIIGVAHFVFPNFYPPTTNIWNLPNAVSIDWLFTIVYRY